MPKKTFKIKPSKKITIAVFYERGALMHTTAKIVFDCFGMPYPRGSEDFDTFEEAPTMHISEHDCDYALIDLAQPVGGLWST